MKKILLCGYFGYSNAGDELILKCLIDVLNDKYNGKNFNVKVLSKISENCSLDKVEYVNRYNLLAIIFTIADSDVVIFTGGLFQDITSSLSLYYYLSIIILAKLMRKKILLLGVDFGPLLKKFNITVFRLIVGFCEKIYVRTKGSEDFLNKINFSNMEKVKVSADIIFSRSNKNDIKEIRFEKPGKTLILVLRSFKRQKDNNVLIAKATIICNILNKGENFNINLIPFQIKNDMELMIEIARKVPGPMNIIKWHNCEDIFRIMQNAELIISQRLHALIVGFLFGIPAIAISDDPKILYLMDEFELSKFTVKDFSEEIIVGMISELINSKNIYREKILKKVDILKERSTIWLEQEKAVFGM